MNNTILYHEEAQRSKNKKNNNNIVNKKYTDYYGVPALIDSIKIKIDITLYYSTQFVFCMKRILCCVN